MTRTAAYAALEAGGPLRRTDIERREPGPHDVVIEIAFVGICHTDIHMVRAEWGPTPFPLVPGHEIAGRVAAVGTDVQHLAVGDPIGVGCLVGSCGRCRSCNAGEEQYCLEGSIGTYGDRDRDGTITQGGYARTIVVDERFVVRIPDALSLHEAAPLLCAGITTYSPLRHWSAGPGARVAVVGLGGLGHVAVKLAHAMGATVTVLTRTTAKRDDARRLGAVDAHATSRPETFEELAGTFDLIINTVSSGEDQDGYLGMLDTDGTMVYVGAPAEPMSLHASALYRRRRSIAGSSIGGIAETQEMLDFCAENGVAAEVEVIAADSINDAYARLLASDVRYRFVIDASTI